MTRRLYYDDCYLTEFTALATKGADDGNRVYLDATAFYPTSGGQPHDTGVIGGVAVMEVMDEGDRIAHVTATPVTAGVVVCRVDWARRFDHMQQHSGQHLLSAVLEELYHIPTVSFHLGADSATIDVIAAGFDRSQAADLERRANEVIFENRPITIGYRDAGDGAGLRKRPERDGVIRVVTIAGLDNSACGGTHVRSTGEIGLLLLRKMERVRQTLRIEFLCGMRAVRRARADYEALSQTARVFSSSLDEAPALVAEQMERLQEAEKHRRRLAAALAEAQGRQLYQSAEPDAAGLRRHVVRLRSGAIGDEIRAEAQGFTAGSRAVFLAVVEETPALLLAVSADSGLHAGNTLKPLLVQHGGRGGGNAQVAQGSLPTPQALEMVVAALG
ncbi:MAG: alanyl-tRNA editing protein [Bryobacteraceae bacterium]